MGPNTSALHPFSSSQEEALLISALGWGCCPESSLKPKRGLFGQLGPFCCFPGVSLNLPRSNSRPGPGPTWITESLMLWLVSLEPLGAVEPSLSSWWMKKLLNFCPDSSQFQALTCCREIPWFPPRLPEPECWLAYLRLA